MAMQEITTSTQQKVTATAVQLHTILEQLCQLESNFKTYPGMTTDFKAISCQLSAISYQVDNLLKDLGV